MSHKECRGKGRTDELTGLAVINVGFAVASGEARPAAAVVTAQSVLAGRPIVTGVLHTLFDVHLTGLTYEGTRVERNTEQVLLKLLKNGVNGTDRIVLKGNISSRNRPRYLLLFFIFN